MENATAAGSSQSNVSRLYILKRQQKNQQKKPTKTNKKSMIIGRYFVYSH